MNGEYWHNCVGNHVTVYSDRYGQYITEPKKGIILKYWPYSGTLMPRFDVGIYEDSGYKLVTFTDQYNEIPGCRLEYNFSLNMKYGRG